MSLLVFKVSFLKNHKANWGKKQLPSQDIDNVSDKKL